MTALVALSLVAVGVFAARARSGARNFRATTARHSVLKAVWCDQ